MCEKISKSSIYCSSGIMLDYVETNFWVDNSIMNSNKTDGLIYIEENNKYYVLSNFLAGYSLNAKIFGAKGDGNSDDTLPIQNMMDFAWSLRNVGVYINVHFPRGKYKLTDKVQVPTRISITGEGINASVIFTDLTNHDLFDFRETKNVLNVMIASSTINDLYTKISNISFYGINKNLNNTQILESKQNPNHNTGLYFSNMVKVELDSVCLRGFLKEAVNFNTVYYIKLKNVNLEWNRKGLVASNCTSIHSINCEFRINSIGIFLYSTYAFSFINALVESNVLAIDNNPISHDVNNLLNPQEKSSIGVLLLGSWGGNFSGCYFEDQIVDVFYLNSKNINFSNSFFCNESFWQKPINGYMQPYSFYMINSQENIISENSYATGTEGIPAQQKMQMYIAPNSYNNIIKINKKEDFDNWFNSNGWIFNEFENNGIAEKSPRVLCESSNIEYLNCKQKAISGIFYGSNASERPSNPKIGYLFFNVTIAKIEFFDGVNWIVT